MDPILFTAAYIRTFEGSRPMTNASGFFFERGGRLFLATSRHVLLDEPSEHRPDRIEIDIHTNPGNLAEAIAFSMPLYVDGRNAWREGTDAGGTIDIAAIEIDRRALTDNLTYRAFSMEHLVGGDTRIEIGTPLLVVGFPLGFHDTLHHVPVARHAIVASSFGLRFQGHGYFLTDARTHRGMSGAPVVTHAPHSDAGQSDLPWKLLGVHSARLDIGTRDAVLDEALGLNCAWYADVLTTLTEPPPP